MGEVRLKEMEEMARVLDLTDLTVLDLPDGGLKDMDPIEIENVVRTHIERVQPDVVVSYPVHGISGFHDHLVTHAVVKRIFCEMKSQGVDFARRLAMNTLHATPGPDFPLTLHASTEEDIDCVMPIGPEDRAAQVDALACYKSYRAVIDRINPAGHTGDFQYFEIFAESHDPPLEDVTADM